MTEDDSQPGQATTDPSGLLAPVRVEVTRISEASTDEDWLLALNNITAYIAELMRLKAVLMAVGLEIVTLRGPIKVRPGVVYRKTNPKTTKCTDLPGAVEALLDASGGDFGKFVNVLSSGAIKPGAASKVLSPEAYKRFFLTTYPDTLEESGGKTAGRLARVDDFFLPAKKA